MYQEYPRLMWHKASGAEVTVRSTSEQEALERSGYALHPGPHEPEPVPIEIIPAAIGKKK